MGGTSDDTINTGLANLVGLCAACHSHVHMNPTESYATGYLVKMGMDPASVPLVLKPGSHIVRLTTDGRVERDGDWNLF